MKLLLTVFVLMVSLVSRTPVDAVAIEVVCSNTPLPLNPDACIQSGRCTRGGAFLFICTTGTFTANDGTLNREAQARGGLSLPPIRTFSNRESGLRALTRQNLMSDVNGDVEIPNTTHVTLNKLHRRLHISSEAIAEFQANAITRHRTQLAMGGSCALPPPTSFLLNDSHRQPLIAACQDLCCHHVEGRTTQVCGPDMVAEQYCATQCAPQLDFCGDDTSTVGNLMVSCFAGAGIDALVAPLADLIVHSPELAGAVIEGVGGVAGDGIYALLNHPLSSAGEALDGLSGAASAIAHGHSPAFMHWFYDHILTRMYEASVRSMQQEMEQLSCMNDAGKARTYCSVTVQLAATVISARQVVLGVLRNPARFGQAVSGALRAMPRSFKSVALGAATSAGHAATARSFAETAAGFEQALTAASNAIEARGVVGATTDAARRVATPVVQSFVASARRDMPTFLGQGAAEPTASVASGVSAAAPAEGVVPASDVQTNFIDNTPPATVRQTTPRAPRTPPPPPPPRRAVARASTSAPVQTPAIEPVAAEPAVSYEPLPPRRPGPPPQHPPLLTGTTAPRPIEPVVPSQRPVVAAPPVEPPLGPERQLPAAPTHFQLEGVPVPALSELHPPQGGRQFYRVRTGTTDSFFEILEDSSGRKYSIAVEASGRPVVGAQPRYHDINEPIERALGISRTYPTNPGASARGRTIYRARALSSTYQGNHGQQIEQLYELATDPSNRRYIIAVDSNGRAMPHATRQYIRNEPLENVLHLPERVPALEATLDVPLPQSLSRGPRLHVPTGGIVRVTNPGELPSYYRIEWSEEAGARTLVPVTAGGEPIPGRAPIVSNSYGNVEFDINSMPAYQTESPTVTLMETPSPTEPIVPPGATNPVPATPATSQGWIPVRNTSTPRFFQADNGIVYRVNRTPGSSAVNLTPHHRVDGRALDSMSPVRLPHGYDVNNRAFRLGDGNFTGVFVEPPR